MKTLKIIAGLLLLAGFVFIYTGCKKKSTAPTPTPTDTSVATDNALAESSFENAKVWADVAMANAGKKSTLTDTVYMGTCVLATLDLSTLPFKLVIDFGNANCQCDDGKFRKGKIIVQFNGNYFAAGTVITYTFDNYFINNNQILGTKTVTNKGRNTANNLWWTVDVAGSVIKANNGGTITWNCNYELEWTEGEITPAIWWDDVYMITGVAGGVGANSKTYTATITKGLRKKLNCEWVESGTISYNIQDLPLIVVDYGDGTCDNVATATVNGTVYTIHLN
ncbi:MAG: hypothetical protein WCK34_08615 [Bacteroidota bacterium]